MYVMCVLCPGAQQKFEDDAIGGCSSAWGSYDDLCHNVQDALVSHAYPNPRTCMV